MLNRECTSDYPLPDSKLTIPRGTPILIPIYGIQRDSTNFNDPLDYRPERFLEQSTSGMAYMPFGEGPRHCIGMWCRLLFNPFYLFQPQKEIEED